MKYKLLKEYPGIKVGTIGEPQQFDGHSIKFNEEVVLPESFCKSHPDWFEPVIERWRASENKEYFYFDAYGVSGDDEQNHGSDKEKFEFGNYFKTRDQAEEASKRIKKCLMEYHKELVGVVSNDQTIQARRDERRFESETESYGSFNPCNV